MNDAEKSRLLRVSAPPREHSRLSEMDAELAALEARRDKTRGLKQAMM